MQISPSDVVILESQVMTDDDDGGGRATGNIIPSGQINNVYPDISRLDRTVGDVGLRKMFVGVRTANQAVYLGAHAIIQKRPVDPNVKVVLFDAGSEDDERLSAQNRIESYVVQGSEAQWALQNDQFEGQRSVVGFQRDEQEIPEVGEVFFLKNPANGDEQYIRITEVNTQTQTYTVLVGSNFIDFERRRLDIGISAPLKVTFPGGQVRPEGPSEPHSDVFTTEIANASNYWGAALADEAVNIGDVSVKVDSVFSNLVPSAQTETPILDQSPFPGGSLIVPATAEQLNQSQAFVYISTTTVQGWVQRPAVRGTVTLTLGGSIYQDNGAGVLTRATGSSSFPEISIDYATGRLLGTRDTGTGSGVVTGSIAYQPGGAFSGRRISEATPITISNRGFNFIESFPTDKPRPGTLKAEYLALGTWYTIADIGTGQLSGAGSGSINFTTGTANVTLEALPDIGSDIIWSYIVDIDGETETHEGTSAALQPEFQIAIDPGSAPGTVVVTYTAGSTTYTANDTASVGFLAGDGEGEIDYAGGLVIFRPDLTPDDGTTIDIAYDSASANVFTIPSPAPVGNVLSGTIPNAPLKPGSVTIEAIGRYVWSQRSGTLKSRVIRLSDDGAGGWNGAVGTLDLNTGAFSVEITRDFDFYEYSYNTGVIGSPQYRVTQTRTINRNEQLQGAVTIRYQPASVVPAAGTTSAPQDTLTMQLIDTRGDIIDSSVLFEWAGQTYYDRSGILYTNFAGETGAGTAVGTIDLGTATITLDTWPEGAAPGVNIIAALTTRADIVTDSISLRTAGSPLRPQSFNFTVTDENSNIINEAADAGGVIATAEIDGRVNYETGVARLQFTDGTNPIFVYPDTARYSAILYSFLPLDAELIGLDPVRLPSDGRVPIFREGDVVVLMDPQELAPFTPTDGQVVNTGRTSLGGVDIVDANGAAMDPAQYTVNLATGTVTFESPVVLQQADTTALVMPVTLTHRVEHMSVVNDVQITGEISFVAPAGHPFPIGSVVSSAKVFGDLSVRALNFFTQKTWNSGTPNWGDERIGDDTAANYNIVDNPIEIANHGCVTEKWALVFTSSGGFYCAGETLGIIGSSTIGVDFAPINPNNGQPYFIIRAAGFGSGWATNNVIRFDTRGLLGALWTARTVLSGEATENEDRFTIQIRGDSD